MSSSFIHNTSKQNTSFLSTQVNSRNKSARAYPDSPRSQVQIQLVYASKPFKKQSPHWNQSTSTWRHSSPKVSIPRQERFKAVKPYSLDIIEPSIIDTKSKKSCSFGKGKKKPISEVVLRNAKEKPSPDAYFLDQFDEEPRKAEKGKTFGSAWTNYEKVYLNHRKDVYSGHFVKNNPPAKYEVREKPGKDRRAFSAYGRQKTFTEKMMDTYKGIPGPHHQVKDRHLYKTVGLNERNFSFGERLDLSAPANNHPGSQYVIPGFCDLFLETKKKNCPK